MTNPSSSSEKSATNVFPWPASCVERDNPCYLTPSVIERQKWKSGTHVRRVQWMNNRTTWSPNKKHSKQTGKHPLERRKKKRVNTKTVSKVETTGTEPQKIIGVKKEEHGRPTGTFY